MKFLALAFVVSSALVACRTRVTSEPAGASLFQIEKLVPQRAWRAFDAGVELGTVVLYVDPATPDDPAKHYFSVRNAFQQELGSLDGLGRAWKFSPHEREAKLVGTGTVQEGVRLILGASAACALEETTLEALRAEPRKAPN